MNSLNPPFALALILSSLAPSANAQTSLAAAREAHARQDFVASLAAYQEVLRSDPRSGEALLRVGEMRCWGVGVPAGQERNWKGAFEAFDALVALDPRNHFALLARARCELAAGERARAQRSARAVLELFPDNRQARLVLADIRLAAKDYAGARDEYQSLLAADPGDSEALIGVARTHHYSFATDIARGWYRRVLELQPDNREAQFGLAWTEFGADPAGAGRRADELQRRYPGDPRVEQLRTAARKARSPFFSVGAGRTSDNFDNEISASQLEGRIPLGSQVEGSLVLTRQELGSGKDARTLEGTATSIAGGLSIATVSGQRLNLKAIIDHRKAPGGTTENKGAGGATYQWGLGRTFSGRVGFDRDNFRYTPESLTARVVIDRAEGGLSLRIGRPLFVDVSGTHWEVGSARGDAKRNAVSGAVGYRFLNMEVGYSVEHSRFDRDLGVSGFFTPTRLTAHRLEWRAVGRVGTKVRFFLAARGGTQSYRAGTAANPFVVDDDRFLSGSFAASFRVSEAVTFDVSGNTSESGVGGVGGARSNAIGARVRVSARNPW